MELSELIESVDILEYISQYTEFTEKNGEYWALSPFKDEKTPSFSVRKETNSFYDFSSGIGGNVLTFIRYYDKCGYAEAIEKLKNYSGVDGNVVTRKKLATVEVAKRFMPPKKVQKQSKSTVLPDDYMERYEKRPDKLAVWEREGISKGSLDKFDVYYDSFSDRLVYTKTDEFGYISYTDEGIAFASKIFEVLNEVKDNFTDAYSFNIESVPAERAAVILCQKDNVLYDHNDKFIYSNQWIPLSAKCTIQEKLRLSSILDEKCSGGSIAHINLESNFPNTETAWKMLNKIAQAGVIYFAFNTRINECKNHHGFVGTDHCPVCGEPVFDTYQRIVGYLVPSRAYSKDRFREFNTRQWYSYAEAMSE